MRNPARISLVLTLLEMYWEQHPDLRLGQILGNFSELHDPYYLEDEDLVASLTKELGLTHGIEKWV